MTDSMDDRFHGIPAAAGVITGEGAQAWRCQPTSSREALVDADLDTRATALYASTDDLLKAAPERLPWRPAMALLHG
jgi:hypothetical protein